MADIAFSHTNKRITVMNGTDENTETFREVVEYFEDNKINNTYDLQTDSSGNSKNICDGDTRLRVSNYPMSKKASSIHGITVTEAALSIVESVLLMKNLIRTVFYRRTILGLKPSFCKSLMMVAASSSFQKAPTKSLTLFLVASFERL